MIKVSRRIPDVHGLKIRTEYFADVYLEIKTFEIRKNDRDYRVGDFLILNEVRQLNEEEGPIPTGRSLSVKITYMTDYEQKEGYVVMSIKLKDLPK